jgi:hypothetical protein
MISRWNNVFPFSATDQTATIDFFPNTDNTSPPHLIASEKSNDSWLNKKMVRIWLGMSDELSDRPSELSPGLFDTRWWHNWGGLSSKLLHKWIVHYWILLKRKTRRITHMSQFIQWNILRTKRGTFSIIDFTFGQTSKGCHILSIYERCRTESVNRSRLNKKSNRWEGRGEPESQLPLCNHETEGFRDCQNPSGDGMSVEGNFKLTREKNCLVLS